MNDESIICEGCKAPIDFCICAHPQKFTVDPWRMTHLLGKGSGYLVTTKKGLRGRTYHSKGLINNKVPVYLEGKTTAMLCAPDSLTLNGFID